MEIVIPFETDGMSYRMMSVTYFSDILGNELWYT